MHEDRLGRREAPTEPCQARNGLADLDLAFFGAAIVMQVKRGRFLAIGELGGEIVVSVVFKPLGTEAISVISMRPASRKEGITCEPEVFV